MKKKELLEDLNSKEVTQLERLLQEERDNLASLIIQHRLNRVKDYTQIRKSKRNIALMLTVLNQKRKEELRVWTDYFG